nr:glycosyltransferase [Lachnospiraceae bacterium]
MPENKKISIIVPVYNTAKYLERCLDSLTNQTYKDIEIVIVDDGSTDSSGAICDEYAAKDHRIKVIHTDNHGSSSARNTGIKESTGEYIGFCDSDDISQPEMYETLIKGIEKYCVSMAQVGRKEVTPEGEFLPDICTPPKEDTKEKSLELFKEMLMHRGDCSFCTKLFKRELFFEGGFYGFPEGKLNEDFNLMVKLLEKIPEFANLSPQLYYVYYRPDSNGRKKDEVSFSRVYADGVENGAQVLKDLEENRKDLI